MCVKFGTDGVRGVANIDLTASFALDLGHAAARVLGGAEAVVGGDTRLSTAMLEAAFVAGLASEGVVVHRLGVVATPGGGVRGGPAQLPRRRDLGLPQPLSGQRHQAVRPRWQQADRRRRAAHRGGRHGPPAPTGDPAQLVDIEPSPAYVEHVLGAIGGRRLDGLRIVVDAANGAATALAGPLLALTGADVVAIHDAPDGRNINAGCGATDTASLAAAVVEHGADLGLALDGDADRLLAIDHTGGFVDGDHIIGILAIDRHAAGLLRDGTVVVTVMTNLGFRLGMEAAGIKVVETAVGDRYVLEVLAAGGYSLGGEQSGHVIFRDIATTGDGLLTGLILCDAVHRAGRPLADLAADAMTRLPQILVNVPVRSPMPDAAVRVAEAIAVVEADLGGRAACSFVPAAPSRWCG